MQSNAASTEDGCPNATQGEFARWAPKCKTHSQRKRPNKGALGKKTSWRMHKNKFWLGGRPFNTTSPRLGALMQRKARLQDGHPNATQGTSASWAPECNARHVCKLGTPTHVGKLGAPKQRKAHPQFGHPNARPQHKRKARPHVHKLGTATQRKARPQDGRPNAKLIRNENVQTREH